MGCRLCAVHRSLTHPARGDHPLLLPTRIPHSLALHPPLTLPIPSPRTQYPIPSDRTRPEGLTEEIIGRWVSKDPSRREKVVLATKITGGRHVTPRNIRKDCEGSLRRLGTDYIDLYLLHWPARYTPQVGLPALHAP